MTVSVNNTQVTAFRLLCQVRLYKLGNNGNKPATDFNNTIPAAGL